MGSAVAIYQSNLDAVSDALWACDLASVLMHVALPNYMGTNDADLVICSPDEMFIVINDFRDQMARQGADGYRRTCVQAAFVTPRRTMITGLHETQLLRNGEPLRPPYLNRMTLLRAQGRWLAFRLEAEAPNAETGILSADLAEAQRREMAQRDVHWQPG